VLFVSWRPQPDAARVYVLWRAADGFIRSLLFTVLAIYFVLRVGMDPLQLVLVGTVLEATIVLFELPTGVFADVFSRRLSIVVGHSLFGLAYIAQGAIPLFGSILVAEAVRAIGETCLSGARQAWLAGELGQEDVAQVMLRGVQAHRWASLVGIAASVALANIDLQVPILSGGVLSLVLAVSLLMLMPEHGFRPARPTSNRAAVTQTVQAAVTALRNNRLLLQLFGLAAILGAASEGFDRLWEAHILANFTLPTLGSLGPVTWFGLIDGGALVIAIAAVHGARRLNTSSDRFMARLVIVLQLLRALAIAVLALTSQLGVAILARWTTQALGSVSAPLVDAWLARNTPSQVRATIYSAIGQGDAMGQVLGGPGIGLIGSLWSVRAAILASATLLLPGALLLRPGATSSEDRIQGTGGTSEAEQPLAAG
jgi:MFS family permease